MNCPGKKTIAKNSKKIEIIVFNPLHVFCTYCLSNLRNKYCAQHFFFAMSALFRYSFFWRQKKTGKTKQVSRRQRASSLYTRASTNALRKLGRCKDDKREKKREKSIGKTHGKLQKKKQSKIIGTVLFCGIILFSLFKFFSALKRRGGKCAVKPSSLTFAQILFSFPSFAQLSFI